MPQPAALADGAGIPRRSCRPAARTRKTKGRVYQPVRRADDRARHDSSTDPRSRPGPRLVVGQRLEGLQLRGEERRRHEVAARSRSRSPRSMRPHELPRRLRPGTPRGSRRGSARRSAEQATTCRHRPRRAPPPTSRSHGAAGRRRRAARRRASSRRSPRGCRSSASRNAMPAEPAASRRRAPPRRPTCRAARSHHDETGRSGDGGHALQASRRAARRRGIRPPIAHVARPSLRNSAQR